MKLRLLMLASTIVLTLSFAAVAGVAEESIASERLAQIVKAGGPFMSAPLRPNSQRFQNEMRFREGVDAQGVGEIKPYALALYQDGIALAVRSMRQQSGVSEAANLKGATRVTVTGDATVQATPDTAILMIAVVTQNPSASEAQAENASKSDRVMRALKTLLGPNAEIKTSGYSLQPRRVYKENQPPTISGCEARNTVTVTMGDLTKVGAVIDAATGAGANSVDNLQFTLRRDRPSRDQALTEATREALSKAGVVAQTLGGRVVRVVEVQESGTARPPIIYARQEFSVARADVATPIEVGTLDIKSQVQLVAEIEVRP